MDSCPNDFSKQVDIPVELEHPCITKVQDVLEDNNLFVIVMEYAAGTELFDQGLKDNDVKALTEPISEYIRPLFTYRKLFVWKINRIDIPSFWISTLLCG